MSLYREQVFPRVMNAVMADARMSQARRRVCADLAGDVVEIGFGTGLNLPHLTAAVTRLRAVEPSGVAVRLARERIAAAPFPVEVAGLDGQSLPFGDASADGVLCTWSLCTIPDPVRAVAEARRVLRPGGRMHFVEHGRAPDEGVRRWQRRLNGLQQRLACGCHLDRDVPALLEAGGLRVARLDTYYAPGEPRPYGSMYEGVAAA